MRRRLEEGREKRSRRLGESGQALIEAAIAAPLFFVLLMGAAELARVAYAAIEIQNAAEEVALYGAQTQGSVLGNSAAGNAAATQVAQTDAGNLTGVSASMSYGHYCSDGTAADSKTYACATGYPETSVNVITAVSFDPLIHIPGLPSKFNLIGNASETCGYC